MSQKHLFLGSLKGMLLLLVGPAEFVSITVAIALSASDSEIRGGGGAASAGSDDRLGLRARPAPLLDAVEDHTVTIAPDGAGPEGSLSADETDEMLQRFLDLVPQQLQPGTLDVTLNRLDAFWEAWRKVPDGTPGVAEVEKIVRALFHRAIEAEMLEIESLEHDSRQAALFADLFLQMRLIVSVPDDADLTKTMTHTRALLNVVRDSFEEWCKKCIDAEQARTEDKLHAQPPRLRAIVHLIVHLCVRRLIAARVLAKVVNDLIGVRDRTPAAELIHCVTDVLMVMGRSMDGNNQGRTLITKMLERLTNLEAIGTPAEPYYPQETRDRIQNLRDARDQKWPAEPSVLLIVHRVRSLLDVDGADLEKVKSLLESRNRPEWLPPSCVELKALLKRNDPLADAGPYLVFKLLTTGETVGILPDEKHIADRKSILLPDEKHIALAADRKAYCEIFDTVTSDWLLTAEKRMVALLWPEDNSITNVHGHFTEAEHAGRVLEASRERAEKKREREEK